MSSKIRVVRIASALAGILAALSCDSVSAPRVHVVRVEVDLPAPTILLGTTAEARARAFDLNGQEIEGLTASWNSDANNVVTVDKAGVLTAHALGMVNIGASIGGVTSSARLNVVPVPVASVDVTPRANTLNRGQSLQFRADVRSQFGDLLTDRAVTWTTSAPGIASVSSSGVVTGIAAGDAAIVAACEGLVASASIHVIVNPVPGGPSIATITPSLLAPGITAVIAGTGFGADLATNEVRVAGVVATVTSASSTALVVQIPATGFGCEATREVFVQVVSGTTAGAKPVTMQVAPQRVLQPGESQILSHATDAQCFELAATGGDYVISVYNTGTSLAQSAGFTLRGVRGVLPAGTVQPVAPARVASRAPIARAVPITSAGALVRLLSAASQRTIDDAHARLYQANIDFLRLRAADIAAALAAPPTPSRRANAVANQSVGAVIPLRIPNVGGFLSGGASFCSDYFQIGARVVYSGVHAIIVEDTASTFNGAPTLAGQMDSLYLKLGSEFDNVMYDIDRSDFGDPLRMDDLLSGTGKITMLFSPRINSFSGLAAFVVTCDFLTTQSAPSSNHTEMFYAVVPTDPGLVGSQFQTLTREDWYRNIRSTVVHEVKHIAAFATRIRDFNQSFEEFWLEEGLARQAEEIWARTAAYNGLTQGANAPYASTLFCDVRPDPAMSGAPQCAGKPFVMYKHFGQNGLYDYLHDNERRSPLGPAPGISDGSFYGSAWSLVRWSVDNHPFDEAQFFTALVHSSQSGVANLTGRLGRPWEEILGEWSLSLYLDDYPGFTSANARIGMPSWDVRSVYSGMHGDFPVMFPLAYPLVPHAEAFGDFTFAMPAVAGGSFSMFMISGTQTGRQLLQLLGAQGGAPDPTFRVAIARID